MDNYLVKAIFNLKPTAEFVIENDDYSTIVWHVLEGSAPTLDEIDQEIKKIKSTEDKAKADKEVAKAELLAKLGITQEEAALLLA